LNFRLCYRPTYSLNAGHYKALTLYDTETEHRWPFLWEVAIVVCSGRYYIAILKFVFPGTIIAKRTDGTTANKEFVTPSHPATNKLSKSRL